MTSFGASKLNVERRGFGRAPVGLKPLPRTPKLRMNDIDVEPKVAVEAVAPVRSTVPYSTANHAVEYEDKRRPSSAEALPRRRSRALQNSNSEASLFSPMANATRERRATLSDINKRVDSIMCLYENPPEDPVVTASTQQSRTTTITPIAPQSFVPPTAPEPYEALPASKWAETKKVAAEYGTVHFDLKGDSIVSRVMKRLGVIESKVNVTRLGETLKHLFEEVRKAVQELGGVAAEAGKTVTRVAGENATLKERIATLNERREEMLRGGVVFRNLEDPEVCAPASPTQPALDSCAMSSHTLNRGDFSDTMTIANAHVRAKHLWAKDANLTRKACGVMVEKCRQLGSQHRGFEVLCEGDSFTIAFREARDAMDWAITLQTQLLKAAWPAELLHIPECVPTENTEGKLLWNGLRVCIGIHKGLPIKTNTPSSFAGPILNVCAEIAKYARGGEILILESLHNEMQANTGVASRVSIRDAPAISLSHQKYKTFTYLPNSLTERVFMENQLEGDAATIHMWRADREKHLQTALQGVKEMEVILNKIDVQKVLPHEEMTCAVVRLERCVDLWKRNAVKTRETLASCADVITASIRRYGGVLTAVTHDTYTAAFERTDASLQFSAEVHISLQQINLLWNNQPSQIIDSASSADPNTQPAPICDEMLASIGIHICSFATRTMATLFDADESILKACLHQCRGGDTFISHRAYESETRKNLPGITLSRAGVISGIRYYISLPESLKEREAAVTSEPPIGKVLCLSEHFGVVKENAEKELAALREVAENEAESAPIGGHAPPEGSAISFAFASVQNSTALWEHNLTAMGEATKQLTALLRHCLMNAKGYEVTNSGTYVAAFAVAENALSWCRDVQEKLLLVDWPKELLSHPDASHSIVGVSTIWKGPRLKMACMSGSVEPHFNDAAGRMEYYGPALHSGDRLMQLAEGGQILLPSAEMDAMEPKGVTINFSSKRFVRGIEGSLLVTSVTPTSLIQRNFIAPDTSAHSPESEMLKLNAETKEGLAIDTPIRKRSMSVVSIVSDVANMSPKNGASDVSSKTESDEDETEAKTISLWSKTLLKKVDSLDDDAVGDVTTAVGRVFNKLKGVAKTRDITLKKFSKSPRVACSPRRRSLQEAFMPEPCSELQIFRKRLVNIHQATRQFCSFVAMHLSHIQGDMNRERLTEDEFMTRFVKLVRKYEDCEAIEKKKMGNYRSAFAELAKTCIQSQEEEERLAALGSYAVLYRSIPGLLSKVFVQFKSHSRSQVFRNSRSKSCAIFEKPQSPLSSSRDIIKQALRVATKRTYSVGAEDTEKKDPEVSHPERLEPMTPAEPPQEEPQKLEPQVEVKGDGEGNGG